MPISVLTRLPAAALWAASHPLEATGRAVGLARGVVVGGIGLVEGLVAPVPAQRSTTGSDGPVEAPGGATDLPERPTSGADLPPPVSPYDEPPVDVVGQALAAEARAQREGLDPTVTGTGTGALHGEPHPVTREEEHEGAPLVRAEREELLEETDEGLRPDQV